MADRVDIRFIWLDHGRGLEPPRQQTAGAAGVDLVAALAPGEVISLAPGQRTLVPTGIAMAIPLGYEAQIRPRSGLAAKHGVTVLNSPGLVDSGYRDELRVILVNTDPVDSYDVRRGDRIAQLVVQRVEHVALREVAAGELPDSERGLGGFGHSGR